MGNMLIRKYYFCSASVKNLLIAVIHIVLVKFKNSGRKSVKVAFNLEFCTI